MLEAASKPHICFLHTLTCQPTGRTGDEGVRAFAGSCRVRVAVRRPRGSVQLSPGLLSPHGFSETLKPAEGLATTLEKRCPRLPSGSHSCLASLSAGCHSTAPLAGFWLGHAAGPATPAGGMGIIGGVQGLACGQGYQGGPPPRTLQLCLRCAPSQGPLEPPRSPSPPGPGRLEPLLQVQAGT